jgi:hypothetical protein
MWLLADSCKQDDQGEGQPALVLGKVDASCRDNEVMGGHNWCYAQRDRFR